MISQSQRFSWQLTKERRLSGSCRFASFGLWHAVFEKDKLVVNQREKEKWPTWQMMDNSNMRWCQVCVRHQKRCLFSFILASFSHTHFGLPVAPCFFYLSYYSNIYEMFTPPPSPLPRNSAKGKQPAAHVERDADHAAQPSPTTHSYVSGRHFFRVFALVGMILATLCTTYLVQGHFTRKNHVPGIIPWQNQHESSSSLSSFGLELHLDKLHRRQQSSPSVLIASRTSTTTTSSVPSSRTTSTSSSRRSTSTTPVSNQPVPTVPSSPLILPTPFPQAFDGSGIPQNFTSTSCAAFFSNMTATAPFRTCRPFSLLLGTSSAFINVSFLFFFFKTFFRLTLFSFPRPKRTSPF